tara:strand:- start:6642 stop:7223 length:582 start_codon:yes stop_codon:yes gene_type:complete
MLSLLKQHKRKVVFAGSPRDFTVKDGYYQAHTIAGLLKYIKKKWHGNFSVVFRPPETGIPEALHNIALALLKLQLGYYNGEHTGKIMLAVDELNISFGHKRPRQFDGFERAILQGAHYGLELMGATQRPTLVHPDFRDNATVVYFFPVMGDVGDVVRACLGSEHAKELKGLKNHSFIVTDNGDISRGKNPPLK